MTRERSSLAQYFEDTETTHETFAKLLGVSRSYVTLIASGGRQPSLSLAVRIQELTGIPVRSLLQQSQPALPFRKAAAR